VSRVWCGAKTITVLASPAGRGGAAQAVPERALILPPLCKGRWVGCQPSRRDCFHRRDEKTILQSAALTASFIQGSLWWIDFLLSYSLCCAVLCFCVRPLSLFHRQLPQRGSRVWCGAKNHYGTCLKNNPSVSCADSFLYTKEPS
jgi:hypothetical protein